MSKMKGTEYFVKVAAENGFSGIHPSVAGFFKRYLQNEKAQEFNGKLVINTHFPPWPSPAFDGMVKQMTSEQDEKRLYNVTIAVTNRCPFHCWHCYNSGRSQVDIPLERFCRLAEEIQGYGAVMVTLTGGEPLLRTDLESLFKAFDDRSCLILGTTGLGLDRKRADQLHDAGVFAVGISLDSAEESEHDRLRGRPGAFRLALNALNLTHQAGMYPYIVSLATREFLSPDRFWPFLEFAGNAGALEVHLLEPCATGRLAGRPDEILSPAERDRILAYQKEVSDRPDLPQVSAFTYLESPEAFGCGAGITHLYIDGSGEVCPCNLVPLSFGNIMDRPLTAILDLMNRHFIKPRPVCLGRTLTPLTWNLPVPTPPDISDRICKQHLPKNHTIPEFFRVRSIAQRAGETELEEAYDGVHADYDRHWLSEAAAPIIELVEKLALQGSERVLEAGCGTGYATRLLAERLNPDGHVTAVDLSGGMLEIARNRMPPGTEHVTFMQEDALKALKQQANLDVIFTTWVLGYIELKPFLKAATGALKPGGRLALVVHTRNSPGREWSIFTELIAENPDALSKSVDFDFPNDLNHLKSLLTHTGFDSDSAWSGAIHFSMPSAESCLEHLLKSGAGTVFFNAILPRWREPLTEKFLQRLKEINGPGPFIVRHDYVACISRKTGSDRLNGRSNPLNPSAANSVFRSGTSRP